MLRYGIIATLTLSVFCSEHKCPADREYDIHNEGRLHSDLLCAYKLNFRPVKDHKNTVNVKIRLALKYLSLDDDEETMTVHSWIALKWKDEFLTWSPADYDNIKEIQMESNEIWSPGLAHFNADSPGYQTSSIYTTCLLKSDGTVMCVPHLTHTARCRTDIKNWPYDIQNCTLIFGAWASTGEQINYTFYDKKPVSLDEYEDGPGWKLLDVEHERLPGKYKCCPNTSYPILKYKFILKRESKGAVAIIVIPCIAVVLLTLTSLFLDINDNTRLFLEFFSMIAHFIYINQISLYIPMYGSVTPIVLLFIRDSSIITLITILETLLLMAMRGWTITPYKWITTVNKIVKSGPAKYVLFTEFDPSNMTERTMTSKDAGSSVSENENTKTTDWLEFANLLNGCVLIMFSIVYIVLLSTYIFEDQ